ncbi:MAG: phage protein Gp37 [Thermodesulfobacteriota bacterium]
MANDLWTTVEEAVLAALETELDGQVNTLASYQGDWQADLNQDYWRFPAVFVQFRQSQGDQVTLGSYDLALEFTILVVTRGNSAKRRETEGIHQILAGVRKALWHQDLGLAMQPLNLIKEEPLFNNREFSVYAAHYGTAIVQDM